MRANILKDKQVLQFTGASERPSLYSFSWTTIYIDKLTKQTSDFLVIIPYANAGFANSYGMPQSLKKTNIYLVCFSPPTLHLFFLMPLLHILGCRNDNIGSFLWSLRKPNHFPDHPLPHQTKLTTKKQHYQKKNISSRQKDEKTKLKKKSTC